MHQGNSFAGGKKHNIMNLLTHAFEKSKTFKNNKKIRGKSIHSISMAFASQPFSAP